MLTDLAALQRRVTVWHEGRFPDATELHVALKLAEEASEVGSAVNGLQSPSAASGRGYVDEEAADVVISLLALLGRWYRAVDLAAEVDRKLTALEAG